MDFFRAEEFEDALKVLEGMTAFSQIGLIDLQQVVYLMTAFVIVLLLKNSMQWVRAYKARYFYFAFGLLFFALLQLNNFIVSTNNSEFLYFNF